MDRFNKILISITLLLIPTYLMRFTILGMPTNVLEVLVLVTFILVLLGRQEFDYKECYRQNKGYFFAIFLILGGLIISTLANGEYRMGLGIIKGWFVVPLMFSWVLYAGSKNERNLKNVIEWLYWGIFGVAVVSLGYYFLGELTYDGRLRGFYLSPNHLAMYLAPAVFIGIYLINLQLPPAKAWYWRAGTTHNLQRSKIKLFIIGASSLVLLAALYLTCSYAAWTAVILSLIITAAIISRKISKKAILTGLIIILLILISQWNTEKSGNLKEFSRSSLESRIMIWKASSKILSDNPIWGIGPGNFQNKYLEYQKYFPPYLEWAVPQPHNLYLAFWLQTGIPGLLGFLIVVLMWLKQMLQIQKNSQLAMMLLAIMIYILLHGLLDTPYWKNDLAIIFWIIIFLGLRTRQIPEVAL